MTNLDSGRHPFEIFTMVLAGAAGVIALAGPARPGSITGSLSETGATIWGAALVLGTGLALISLVLRNRLHGVLMEQIGLVVTGAATIFYAAAAFLEIGTDATVAVAFVTGFGLSCMWRWVQLQRIINAAREEVRRGR